MSFLAIYDDDDDHVDCNGRDNDNHDAENEDDDDETNDDDSEYLLLEPWFDETQSKSFIVQATNKTIMPMPVAIWHN